MSNIVMFYDTNSLLNLGEKVFDDKFFISSVSLEEIESIKTSRNKDDETKYKARVISRLLNEKVGRYETIIYDKNYHGAKLEDLGLDTTPDNKICVTAADLADLPDTDVVFVTYDLNCRLIASEIFGLRVVWSLGTLREEVYKGYKEICGTTEYINEKMTDMDLSKWSKNEYLIIKNTDDDSVKEMRFDGANFIPLKLPTSKYIKAKNSLQRCALDILNNPEITIAVILGGYGSGKSFLTTKMGLYAVLEKGQQSKILCVRNPIGEGTQIGYLKGDFEEKTRQYFLPIVQQLDGGEFECESLKQRGILESNVPFFMKGTSYPSTVILVDEAEDLNEKEIRLIGTRIGENGRVFMSGDYKQSILNNGTNNALVKMCNALKGNEKFACIYLDEDVRSDTSKIFADLFEN